MKRLIALLFMLTVSVHPVVSAQFRPSRSVPDHWLICHGDSLTLGMTLSGGSYVYLDPYPDLVVQSVTTAKGYVFGGVNFGISGQGLNFVYTNYDTFDGFRSKGFGTLTADAVTNVDPLRTLPNARLVIFAGGNDIFLNGTSGSATWTLLQTYINARITAGWPASSICVCTMLPRQGTHESDRITFNSSITSNAAGMGYVVADLAANSNIGVAGADANTTYYNTDRIHPNATGHAVIASIIQTALYP